MLSEKLESVDADVVTAAIRAAHAKGMADALGLIAVDVGDLATTVDATVLRARLTQRQPDGRWQTYRYVFDPDDPTVITGTRLVVHGVDLGPLSRDYGMRSWDDLPDEDREILMRGRQVRDLVNDALREGS